MDYSEWKKLNVGGSVNDYYSYLKREGIDLGKVNRVNVKTEYISNKRRFGVGWYFLIGSIIVAFLLNPDIDRHRDEVLKVINDSGDKELGDWGMLNGVKRWGLSKVMDNVVDVVNRRNYIVFSICDVYVGGEYSGRSVGFYTMVNVYGN
jgi:hypothetical protein